jgi:protein-S-isoprenylcysteine O-methyltransferase
VWRHPSYFGFFWWAIGTQLVLVNPVGLVGFCAVLWVFFSQRIAYEEKHLVEFFGERYVAYRDATPVYIPFIS